MENNLKDFVTAKGADVKINTAPIRSQSGQAVVQSIVNGKTVGSSVDHSSSYLAIPSNTTRTNHFLLMLHLAFNQHKPVLITPDNIWLLICQGFSRHIKLNKETYRQGLTGRAEKQTIQVRRDDFVLGEDNSWEEVLPSFTEQINQLINEDLYANLVLNFSTTTIRESTAFEIAFMDSMSGYFNYEFISLCGIPEIKVGGTVEDYQKMVAALNELRKYDLDWWVDRIILRLEKFIDLLRGNADRRFWNSIYKEDSESGGPFVTGWIADFFPYVKRAVKSENGAGIKKGIDINPRLTSSDPCTFKLDDFPSGISQVPFLWSYLDLAMEMKFISGFIGITENSSDHTLSTEINWMVTED